MAHFKGLTLMFDRQNQGLWGAILDNLHTIMCMPTEPSENIEAFMTCGRNKVIESFT
jgi:hypothetical protein